jgi:hypothetical protein
LKNSVGWVVNPFLHNLDYTFTRFQGSWRIKAIALNKNPPFWRTGDLTVRETKHFLIFARPELRDESSDLVDKSDRAYETLAAQGLPPTFQKKQIVRSGSASWLTTI